MNSRHEDTLGHGAAAAKVGLLQRIHLYQMVGQLCQHHLMLPFVQHIMLQIAQNQRQFPDLVHQPFGHQSIVERSQSLDHANRIELLTRRKIAFTIVLAQDFHTCRHPFFSHKSLLIGNNFQGLLVAIVHQTACGIDIGIGQMRIFAFQTECQKQVFQLITRQSGHE